jgi:ABC-type taurine transport system ATPase subunit
LKNIYQSKYCYSISDMNAAMALQNVMCVLSPSEKGKVPVSSWKEGNTAPTRIRRSEAELTKAAECVQKGMTFQNVSDIFNIPISTIRFYMARRGILPQRRRGRTASTQQPNSGSNQFMMMHYKLEDISKKQSTQ